MMARLPKPTRVDPSGLPHPEAYRTLRDVWEDLDRYRVTPRTHGYPENIVRLWSPVDAVHQAIMAFVYATAHSAVASYYGWADREINSLFRSKLEDDGVYVQLSLDSSEAATPTEVPLVKEWGDRVGNSVAIGHSPFGGISHVKEMVLDGVLTIGGSTNLSVGGQGSAEGGKGAQDNECYFLWDAVYAAETRARLDRIHDSHLQQMAARRRRE